MVVVVVGPSLTPAKKIYVYVPFSFLSQAPPKDPAVLPLGSFEAILRI